MSELPTNEAEGWTSEDWREKRKANQEHRAKCRDSSAARLTGMGIAFTSHNHGAHLKVGDWDFWPGTQKFRNRKNGKRGLGIGALLNAIEKAARFPK